MQDQFDIPAALAVLRRRGWIILLFVLAAVAAASVVTNSQPRRYEATATLFVTGALPTTRSTTIDPASTSLQLATLAQNTSAAYAQLANSRAVAEDAAAALGVPVAEVAGHVRGEAQPGVQLIHVRAEAGTGAGSARLANAAAAALAARAPGRADKRSGGLRLDLVDPAQTPAQPVSPRTTLNLVLGGLAGLLLGLALATVRERLDRRIRSFADASTTLGLPVLGELPRFRRRLRRKNAVDRHAIPRIADPYRSLATTVAVASEEAGHRRLLITSSLPKEGKSTVAAHLSLSLAQDGEGTVLLDCDLHRPSQHRAFPEPSRPPLAEVLHATNGALPAFTEVQARLKVVAGTEADAGGALSVRSPEFVNVIEAAADGHDRVVLDSPPILGPADAGALARRADAAILVIAAGRTREDDAVAALAALTRIGIPVLGVVLSGVRPRRHSSYYPAGR
jgi:capsular exopolysaccharide synthesis family protein